MIKDMLHYFSKGEIALWCGSVLTIILSYFVFGGESCLNLIASCIGVTSLIFCAKGNPIGQVFIIIFSLFYGYVSFTFSYYGEMITYVGMTMPMAVFALISWLKNPYNGNKSEVKVRILTKKDTVFMGSMTAVVTTAFYFILEFFHTANIIPSTLSVATSFVAVYLTYKRSSYYAIAYALNDLVLIALWGFASAESLTYMSLTVCFIAFFINDIYGFISWRRMEKRQAMAICDVLPAKQTESTQ